MNFDGIECYYARYHMQAQKRWLKIAEHRQWLVTGGSDYHGTIKPNIPLGSSWVDKERFSVFQHRFKKFPQPNVQSYAFIQILNR